MLKYPINAGCTIEKAAEAMLDFRDYRTGKSGRIQEVESDFNGIRVTTEGCTSPEQIVRRYDLDSQTERDDYRKSEAYKKKQEERKKELNNKQGRMTVLLETLFSGYDAMDDKAFMCWLAEYIELGDYVGVDSQEKKVAEILLKLGYKDNDLVVNKDNGEKYVSSKNNDKRWIVGQCINMINRGMHVHPILASKAEGWLKQYYL